MTKAVVRAFLLALSSIGTAHAQAQTQTQTQSNLYSREAPLQEYLIEDRAAEIALARSAAPPAISGRATILVLGKRDYETAVRGENGFTCLVERSWMSPFDSPEFWNPRMRGPVCYNAAASRSVLPYTLFRSKLALAGSAKAEMHQRILAASTAGKLSAPEPGAMSYMMSRQGYLGDSAHEWHPHLMFHIPKRDSATWGANLPGSPVVVDSDHTDVPEPQTIFFVPVSIWSDGTDASGHDHASADQGQQ